MNILGLNHGEINSSAVLIRNGKVVAGSPEERFSRVKKTKEFPKQAIDFCLKSENISLKDCECVAQAWNPGESWQKFNPLISSSRIKREDYFYTIPDNLYNLVERNPPPWSLLEFPENTNIPPIYYVRHHLAHAANAFFLSPFKEAAILTCDWKGEYETTTCGFGKENEIEIFKRKKMPHSIGMFYSTYTQLLGYRPDNDEWKVMALSAFDVYYKEYLEKIRNTVKLTDDGLFELDLSFYQGHLLDEPKLYTKKLFNYLGGREGIPGEEPDKWFFSIAKAMQIVSEEIVNHIVNGLYEKTKSENIVLSGGYFMNSVYNGKIIKNTPFKKVYISYSPADVGNSIGTALYVAHCIHNEKRNYMFNSSYIGPSFNNKEVQEVLSRRKIKYQEVKVVSEKVASLLAEGKVVAVSSGRMEFGERALGNRSILGDPRSNNMKDKINSIIKFRESYRPFAPAVLYEKAHQFFEITENYESNFMEKVVPIKKEFHKKLPAVTHIDGSGRLQTVKKEHNEQFYNIISEFEKLTGFPIVLNTSFNINGEPIVLSPDDALNTFYNSGLEYLIINNFLVTK